MFKKGNHVKIKEGTSLKTGEILNGWAGEIQNVNSNKRSCLVILDAQTLEIMDDTYLINRIKEGTEVPFELEFSFDSLELGEKRDTYEEELESIEKISERVIGLEEKLEKENKEQQQMWVEEFLKSDLFIRQTEYQQENSGFIIRTFMDLLHNYEYVTPENWKPSNIKEICINIIPRKITSEQELFDNYGDVIENFISYIGSKKYIKNWEELVEAIKQVKSKISKEANNPKNWGMAKSIMMEAQESGIEFNDEAELESFIIERNRALLDAKKKETKVIPLRSNPFKGIGRNQKITVQYTTGELKEDIKFKKVEQDLIDGKCEILKK